jgi:peroxiredoxin
MRRDDLYALPEALPAPVDDGACDHLPGARVPPVPLPSTGGRDVDLSKVGAPLAVVYCYPRTGAPDREPPGGLDAWNALPGARGCTPESCAFRDRHGELRALGAEVFGLSTQTAEYQREAAERLRLPFELLSDAGFALTESLGLPTFEVEGFRLLKRLTLVIDEGRVSKVFYPVFPPDKHPEEVLRWLSRRR